MKLYRRADGSWAGTPVSAGKNFVQIDIRTDKRGLLEWLNDNVRDEQPPECSPERPLMATDGPVPPERLVEELIYIKKR